MTETMEEFDFDGMDLFSIRINTTQTFQKTIENNPLLEYSHFGSHRKKHPDNLIGFSEKIISK